MIGKAAQFTTVRTSAKVVIVNRSGESALAVMPDDPAGRDSGDHGRHESPDARFAKAAGNDSGARTKAGKSEPYNSALSTLARSGTMNVLSNNGAERRNATR